MTNINVGRWVVGGVVAAVILFIVDYVLNAVILMQQWTDAMTALGRPALGASTGEIVFFAVFDLVLGLAALWIYVGIRPRFGPSVTTAVYAGLATWLLVVALPTAFMLMIGLFPAVLLWIVTIVGVFQVVGATVAGAYLYQEEAS